MSTVSSAQLRAARAYLSWTMEQAAQAASITKRTVIRLERDEGYVERTPPSLKRLVSAYREQSILLEQGGVVVAGQNGQVASRPAATEPGGFATFDSYMADLKGKIHAEHRRHRDLQAVASQRIARTAELSRAIHTVVRSGDR